MDAYTASMSAYPPSPVDGTEVAMPYAEGLPTYSMGAHPGRPDEEQPIMTAMENAAEDAKVLAFQNSASAVRRNSVSATPVNQERLRFWQGPPYYPKAADESARIKDTIMRQPALQVLFGHLSSAAVDSVVGAFFHRQVEVGEILIEQGADGDFFYIVDTGIYEIFVQRHADMPPERVMVVAEPGMSFGELALMYSVPRAATVRCAGAGGLWCLDRESFQMMLITAENSKKGEYDGFLAEVDLLRGLTLYERSVLSDLLESELFDDGEEIVHQGEEGNTFYFLYEGQCKAYMLGPHGEVEVMHYTRPGQYFGEVALLERAPRQCTVRACYGGCVVLKLRREDVDLSVGSIQERLYANAAAYPQYEAFINR